MIGGAGGGLSRGRLRLVLGLFSLALAVPAVVLVVHAYGQLKWEAFHQARTLAEELADRIDQGIAELVETEEQRGFGDYQFLIVRGSGEAGFLQPSPLSEFPPRADFPGLVGHFQVDANGAFTSPLLPQPAQLASRYGIDADGRIQRLQAQQRILRVLTDNRLVSERPASEARLVLKGSAAPNERARSPEPAALGARADSTFDELKKSQSPAATERESPADSAPSVARLLKAPEYPPVAASALPDDTRARAMQRRSERAARKEVSQLAEAAPRADHAPSASDSGATPRITTFESELDPFELSPLDERHLVLYRKVWRDGLRYVQGALIERAPFLEAMIERPFRASSVSGFSTLISAWQGRVLGIHPGRDERSSPVGTSSEGLDGAVLYRTRLSAPATELELVFSVTHMPAGPGAGVVVWVAATLAAVLGLGVALMYRLGCREIAIAEQQRDFVAAVSHELRTPLTSIRMYGEMLREGWASEEKKRDYYAFILAESERLSRLISNVLQLARMTRSEADVELKELTLGELMDGVRSRILSQAEQAGFELRLDLPPHLTDAKLRVDADGFAQIFINLVDNAIKFSSRSAKKRIDIGAVEDRAAASVRLSVRDYGPGVARDQMKKIFQLFYRTENELTRETAGTGIGLALVRELAQSMGASVEVRDARPGAEFSLVFPLERG